MTTAYDSEEAFTRHMDDMQVLYSLKAGQTVTQDDVDALNRLDEHYRSEGDRATDAYHRGWGDALDSAGRADFARMSERVSQSTIDATVARTMESLSIARVDKLDAAIREACDLLAERTHGSAARSPGHNARVVLEAALSSAKPAEREGSRDEPIPPPQSPAGGEG